MASRTESLVIQIHNAVVHNPHLAHRKMQIKSTDGHVTLRGTVRSFFEKQMAQEALRHIDGIQSIENRLQVCWN